MSAPTSMGECPVCHEQRGIRNGKMLKHGPKLSCAGAGKFAVGYTRGLTYEEPRKRMRNNDPRVPKISPNDDEPMRYAVVLADGFTAYRACQHLLSEARKVRDRNKGSSLMDLSTGQKIKN